MTHKSLRTDHLKMVIILVYCELLFPSLVVTVPDYRTERYCVSCEVRTEFIYVMQKKVDRLCGLVVRVPGYRCRSPWFDFWRYQIF
jgi:hypothetical protein